MRIGSNMHGGDVSALLNLNKIFQQLTLVTNQLSTGLRINRGADDPAGMIAAQSMESDLASIKQASQNAAFAQYSLGIADAGVGQTLDQLQTIRGKVVAAANGTTTDQQRAALQQEVNAALQAIDRIGSNTNFAGHKVLDGSTLKIQISPNSSGTIAVQMPNISTSALGGPSGKLSDLAGGGSANLQNGNLEQAQNILDQAESQVLKDRVKIDAFEKYTLETASANLDTMQVNLTSSLSEVRDTDFAKATSDMVRTKILARSLLAVLQSNMQNRGLVLDLLKQ